MSEQNTEQTTELEEVTAIDFAQEATKMVNDKNDWATTKNSMIQWLRDKVGSNVSTSLSNLEDLTIASAKDTAYQAQDYLKDAKRNLLQIMKDPYAKLTMHNNPPRADADDGISWDIPTILGWNDPAVSSGSNSDN